MHQNVKIWLNITYHYLFSPMRKKNFDPMKPTGQRFMSKRNFTIAKARKSSINPFGQEMLILIVFLIIL